MSRILTPRGNGDTITADFNDIRLEDSENENQAKIESGIAAAMGKVLVKKFPNRQWKVIVDVHNEMIVIGCDSVSNTKGYHIHMKNRTTKELQKKAVFAASEILERHNISRDRKYDADQFEVMTRDNTDSVITPDSAAEPI